MSVVASSVSGGRDGIFAHLFDVAADGVRVTIIGGGVAAAGQVCLVFGGREAAFLDVCLFGGMPDAGVREVTGPVDVVTDAVR